MPVPINIADVRRQAASPVILDAGDRVANVLAQRFTPNGDATLALDLFTLPIPVLGYGVITPDPMAVAARLLQLGATIYYDPPTATWIVRGYAQR